MTLDPAEHHTLASVAALLRHTLHAYGLDVDPLVRAAGLDRCHTGRVPEHVPNHHRPRGQPVECQPAA